MTNQTFNDIRVELPIFEDYTLANGGFLINEIGCHALFYYYITAMRNLIKQKKNIVLEGEVDPVYNYKQLFISTAKIYGVSPEKMQSYWPAVDGQCQFLGMEKLPLRYRFAGTFIIT